MLDRSEITNYRRALRQATQELHSRPFSFNLLNSMHATLLDSVRGVNKARGGIRKAQNWIGRPGTPIEAAHFEPTGLPRHLDAWERYYHADAPDALVQLAVIHGQFEFLHPFLDGNGRLGREPEGWQRWCEFFLEAVAAQADANASQLRRVQELCETCKQRAAELTHSEFAVMLVDAIFERPIFSTSQMAERPSMPSRATVTTLLGRLAGGGMLSRLSPASGRRPQIWICEELFALCNG